MILVGLFALHMHREILQYISELEVVRGFKQALVTQQVNPLPLFQVICIVDALLIIFEASLIPPILVSPTHFNGLSH
jgi:hypothetical protein